MKISPALILKNISFKYNSKKISGISSLSYSFSPGKLYALLGPSGSGKSTLLKIIAKETPIQSGEIQSSQLVTHYNEALKYILSAQSKTVLQVLGELDDQSLSAARDLLYDFNITHTHHTQIKDISQGEKQRVTLAYCLLKKSKVLLFDEVFYGIDPQNRSIVIELIKSALVKFQVTIIWATQLINDALCFSDEILIINHGKLVASGQGASLYSFPPNLFCAKFLGPHNALLHSKKNPFPVFQKEENSPDEELIIIRPEMISFTKDSSFKVEVLDSYFYNGGFLHKVQKDHYKLLVFDFERKTGIQYLYFDSSKVHFLEEV